MANRSLPGPPLIAALLQDCYAGPAWHGAALLGTLRSIDAAAARRHPRPAGNSIWELVLHLAYARYRVLRRLGAAPPGRFPRPLRAAWWPRMPQPGSPGQWRADLALLAAYQQQLLDAVQTVPEARLRFRRRGQPRPLAFEVLGVAVHDAYHTGQIRLLLRLRARRAPKRRELA